jgi:hypothetical protein
MVPVLDRYGEPVMDKITGKPKMKPMINIWQHMKDQPLPIEQVLKDTNFTYQINENIQEILQTAPAKGYHEQAKKDQITRDLVTSKLTAANLVDLEMAGRIKTGIRQKRRGFLRHVPPFALLSMKRSPLYTLGDELNQDRNEGIKTTLVTKSTELFLRLKDPTQKQFNRVFFNGTLIQDEGQLLNAAISYTLGVSVKDYRSITGKGAQFDRWKTGAPRKRPGGPTSPFRDINNFEYNFDTINRTVKAPFKIEDGQFIAEQYFYQLEPISQLKAVKDEFNFILSKTNLSDAQQQILTERLVVEHRLDLF